MKVSFQEWWRDFRRENDRDVYEATSRLLSYVEHLPGDERSEFIGELAYVVRRNDRLSGAAAAVLESVADAQACATLYEYLQGLTRADVHEQAQEATVLRILARANPAVYVDAIDAFFLDKPIGTYFQGVIWTQWPDRPDVFARAFMRYFSEVSPDRVKGTLVVQALLECPEALAAIRRAGFAAKRSSLWGEIAHAVRATTMPGMTAQEQSAIAQVLADDAPPV